MPLHGVPLVAARDCPWADLTPNLGPPLHAQGYPAYPGDEDVNGAVMPGFQYTVSKDKKPLRTHRRGASFDPNQDSFAQYCLGGNAGGNAGGGGSGGPNGGGPGNGARSGEAAGGR